METGEEQCHNWIQTLPIHSAHAETPRQRNLPGNHYPHVKAWCLVRGLIKVIPAIVMFGVSPTWATDLTVDGKLGIGVNNPVANVQINQTGLGVGLYLGDRKPFGQALFETDLTTPATHAFFAEMGNPVFSVAAGGDGFFKGGLEVDGFATFKATGTFEDINVADRLNIGSSPPLPCPVGKQPCPAPIGHGDPFLKLMVFGNELITGNELFGAQTREMISLWHSGQQDYGIGVQAAGFYQRTGSDFFWYLGGTHSDNFGDAGGGTRLMRLGRGGDLEVGGGMITPQAVNFGARTRQMLNLFNEDYGVGVQAATLYQRTGGEFAWYRGGSHSDDFLDPGGGTLLMRLDKPAS